MFSSNHMTIYLNGPHYYIHEFNKGLICFELVRGIFIAWIQESGILFEFIILSLFKATPADVEFTKYPSQFINLDRDRPKGVTVVQTLTDGEPITGTFLGPVNVREVVLTEHGISVAVVESNRLPLDAVARVVLPFLLFIACICNLFILRTAYKLSCRRIPLAIYLVYIAALDQIDLLARGTDYLVEAYGGIRLFTAVQFLDRSACQLLTMIHSGLRHLHASLLIGFAIDTLRFTRYPSNYAAVYRREWTRNVLILSAVLAITIDSQFLWTFDLSLLHTKTLHKRLVRKACECGFSTTTTLSPLFVNLIWPLIDHMWTEIIPFTVCAVLGTCTLVTLQLRRRRISVPGQNTLSPDTKLQILRDTSVSASTDFAGYFKTVVYRWFDGHTIHEAPKAYGLLVITDCLFIVPRTIYYLTKYAMFASKWNAKPFTSKDSFRFISNCAFENCIVILPNTTLFATCMYQANVLLLPFKSLKTLHPSRRRSYQFTLKVFWSREDRQYRHLNHSRRSDLETSC